MKTYISHLAHDLLQRFGTDLSRIAVVFPNKRASLFLNQELARQASEMQPSGKSCPVWSPTYITISDLFRRHSDLEVADQILLVCRLYDVFCRVTGFTGESLDRFYNWGLLLLADFDDIDKNMADASKVFQLITDTHEYDTTNYLEPEQREALKHFFSNFSDDHESLMQEKFKRLWSRLYDIYTTFREELRNDGIAYEGMLYRDVIENSDIAFEHDTYCFVGFNMLQQVEQRLFSHLKAMDSIRTDGQPRALFYWDYDSYYLNDRHEAGHFIGEYISRFPDALDGISHTNFLQQPDTKITYISAPTENLQTRYVHDWLLENDRWKAGARTAIVMSDERLLQTIIRSLPKEVEKVNITTGYPLGQSPIVSFIQQLMELQTAGLILGTDKFRLRYVNSVLSHPYAKYISPCATELHQRLSRDKQFFPSRSLLTECDENLQLLFAGIDTITLPDYDSLPNNVPLIIWLQNIVKHIAKGDHSLDALAKESLFRTYQVLQRLFSLSIDGTLDVDVITFRRLLLQIINTTTVPYHGEPIEGVQIMGVLETRCLDFDHILLLSCNEGNLPKGVNDSSFIPHSIRRAYGLTTVENKVGIFSYYFHRLLQRCNDISITYNSSTEGVNTGEMSRFMLQLMVESGSCSNGVIQRLALQTGQETTSFAPREVVKDETIQQRLKEMCEHSVSPSSIGKYLRCQVMYYYMYVARLTDNSVEDPDDMDNIAFGLVFHQAMENIYNSILGISDDEEEKINTSPVNISQLKVIHADDITRVLKDRRCLEECLDRAFAKEVFKISSVNSDNHQYTHFRPEYNGLQLINRRVILRLLVDQLEYDRKSAPFRIMGQERRVFSSIGVNINGTEQKIRIGGSIDRLDIVGNENQGYRIRVVDYKTGAKEQGALNSIDDIFSQENISKHSDYFLQAMLYSHNVRYAQWHDAQGIPVTPELHFVQKVRHDSFSPNLVINKLPITDINDVDSEFIQKLSETISEIHNPDIPFHPTDNDKACENCQFKSLCGM